MTSLDSTFTGTLPRTTAARPFAQIVREIVREAVVGLVRNRMRAGLSMLGISWGIVSVVMLLSYGDGFREALANGFRGAFGEATTVLRGGQTSMQAGGERSGRRVRLKEADYLAVRDLPLVKGASPEIVSEQPVAWGIKQTSYLIRGVTPEYAYMRSQPAASGRFFDAEDVRLQRRVAFIGSEVARKLFGSTPAVGQTIRIKGLPFEVVGVQKEKVQLSSYFRPDKYCIFVPYTTAGQVYNTEYLDTIVYQAVDPVLETKARRIVQDVLARRLQFDPTDERAVRTFGSTEANDITAGIVLGLKLVLGFIGVLTLAIGGIGVMNIMFVSVTERTREIGLRKALGARRRDILLQFLLEGLVTTFAGGAAGIGISWVLVQIFSPRPFLSELLDDTTHAADIYLNLSVELVATCTIILMVVGVVSSLLPALRAARMDPIEALRYE